MKGISDIFGDSKTVTRFGRDVKIGAIISANWKGIFGALAKTLKYSHLKVGVVYIEAENPAWRTEIERYKSGFLEKMNQYLSRERYSIRNIVVKVGNVNRGVRPIIPGKAEKHSQKLTEDKIRKEVRRRQKLGYKLCEQCGKVWDIDSVCTLCRVTH